MQTSNGITLPVYAGDWVEEVKVSWGSVCDFPSHCLVDLLLNKQNVQNRVQECVLAISCSWFWYATNAGRNPDKTVQRANWVGWGLVSRLKGWVWRVSAFSRGREWRSRRLTGTEGLLVTDLRFYCSSLIFNSPFHLLLIENKSCFSLYFLWIKWSVLNALKGFIINRLVISLILWAQYWFLRGKRYDYLPSLMY